MDIRKAKLAFLEELVDLPTQQRQGVSMAIDCLIENEVNGEDKPIVITGFDYFDMQSVLRLTKNFCITVYPHAKSMFDADILQVDGSTSEEACVNLIKFMRSKTSLLYWADSPTWFKHLPSGLFHVVYLERHSAVRGYNEQSSSSIIPIRKTYGSENILTELFDGIKHFNSSRAITTEKAHELFWDEAQCAFVRPIPAPAGMKYDEEITIHSATWQKLACVALRRYQGKECNQGFGWDESDEGWARATVFPVVENLLINADGETRECLIGQVIMEDDGNGTAFLSTVWIHPFYRRKGLLTGLWPRLQDKYGDFSISEPNSNMQAFLKSLVA